MGRRADASTSRRYATLLLCICQTIGREGSKELLLQSLQLFFSAFDWMHATPLDTAGATVSGGGTAAARPDNVADLSVLSEAFDAEMAAYTYSSFCQLMGQETMRRSLYNSSIVEARMCASSSLFPDPCTDVVVVAVTVSCDTVRSTC